MCTIHTFSEPCNEARFVLIRLLYCPVLQAERIILHPGFNATQATSDLAIVVVNKLQYTEYVQPICVWGPVYDKTALFGEQAVVSF